MADGTSALDFAAASAPERTIGAEPPRYPAPSAIGVPAFLAPTSLGEVKELARMIALAEWAPECYRDLDGNYLQPKIELAILHGATVGLGPIAAVHAIALIGGTPSIWGDGALSVIEHSGLLEDMVEDYEDDTEEGLTAICTMKRRDRATPIVTRFSLAMAERAGLTRSEGPWQTYPERMLRMRARSWTMRDAFADVLRGLQLREEVEDYAGRGGARPRRTQPDESHPSGGPRPYASPRPRLMAAASAGTMPAPSAQGGDGLSVDQPEADAGRDGEAHTLIDADGVVSEVVGAEALRTAFEHILFDKHLSLDQARGVWETNELARNAIAQIFGAEALRPAAEYLKSLAEHRRSRDSDVSAVAVQQLDEPVNGSISGKGSSSEPSSPLLLKIDPTWGIQKIFQHYRAGLNALSDRTAPTIAKFREANIGVEQRLRSKLPSRMGSIDSIYQNAELKP